MRLLGPPELAGAETVRFVAERRFQLLALLALRSGQWVPRDQIAALLWPDHDDAQARRNLRHVVFKARAVPGVEGIEADATALRWGVETDLQRFEALLREARALEAMALRRGTLLEGIEDAGSPALSAWLAPERARLDMHWQQAALDALAAAQLPAQRIELAQRLLAFDPLDEAAMGAWLAAELALGNRARAQQLCRDYAHRLADELGVEPSQRLRSLLERAAGADGPAARAAAEPEADDDFVGRRAELAELALLLARPDCRLVTILGPGGIGKSRLARRAVELAAPRFGGGCIWVELQDLGDAQAAVARLAQQLELALDGRSDPIAQIGRRHGARRVLCVLDNAEHLAGLPALLEQLLSAAPSWVLLVTSRVRTHAALEWLLPLAGLPVPDEESRDLEAAVAFDAVRLFALRAGAAQRGFALARHLPAVIAIVDAVGGMPLAIELAAAWVRLLPPREIAQDLRRGLDLFERDPAAPGAPARPEHASLRAVLDRAWQLLAPREREAMAGLAVFEGGFTRMAALVVVQAPLPVLSSLVDKSFLTVDEAGRFGIHPIVAADATERLARDGHRGAAIARAHAEHYLRQLAALAPGNGADPRPIGEGVETEYANCRAAWRHAIEAGLAEIVAPAVGAWRAYFDLRGRLGEGIESLRPALDLLAREPTLQAAAAGVRAALSRLHYRRGDYQLGLALALAGAEGAERCGDRRVLASCLANAGSCQSAIGEWGTARACFERALAIARADGVTSEIAAALNNLGIVAKKEGRYDDALACYAQALATERELGNHAAIVRCLNNLAGVHMERDQWAQARPYMEEGLRLCERYRLDASTPNLAFGLGAVLLELGETDAAEAKLRVALERSRAADIPVVALLAGVNLGRIAGMRSDFVTAIGRLRDAARSAHERGWTHESLQVALFFGECLRDAGHKLAAARTWQMVATYPQCEAGLRDSALRWLAGLALTPEEQAQAEREPVTLAAVTERLLSDRALQP
ncbi:MAG: tetratricopeptide repeat protein [Ideonella sp.]|nr:tetratricopeptide repeat protein [Ideonella sp.]